MSEIEQAALISEQLVRAVGGREQAPIVTAEQGQLRQRHFTLFARAYDQVRRAITFLHWEEDDVDSIAPSLYAGRNTGRRKSTDPKAGTDVPAPATTPAAVSPLATPPAQVAGTAAARASLSAAISLVLRLLGRDPDPAKSREHVLLSLLAERRFRHGQGADLRALLHDLAEPPIDEVGALPLNDFLPKSERRALAAALNTLLASPTFASWREGAPLDVGEWLRAAQYSVSPGGARPRRAHRPRWRGHERCREISR